jgi:two-component system, OmpR family, copper resistance phosphate regulon response regulator CusR
VQAMLNLATNAVQHTGPGDRLGFGIDTTTDTARLWVRDTGPGLSDDVIDRLFTRRFRGAASRAQRSDGMGIGLSIVDAIARGHGGRASAAERTRRWRAIHDRTPPRPPTGGSPMTRILIVEDEERIVSFLEKGLRANGYTTVAVGDGDSAVALARDDSFDLVILDLGLPGRDGRDVLRAVRARGDRLPILVLTARDGVEDTVGASSRGADDYVTKPFRFDELLARIRLRLRTDDRPAETTVLQVGAVQLDLRSRRATAEERTVELTAREFALLETFMRHPGQVLAREQLLSHVWGYDFDPGSNVVDVYVRYLRRKLGESTIETVRGMGYRMAN